MEQSIIEFEVILGKVGETLSKNKIQIKRTGCDSSARVWVQIPSTEKKKPIY
jgi:hypothetical protein